MSKFKEICLNRKLMYVIAIIVSCLYIFIGNKFAVGDAKLLGSGGMTPEKVKVTEIVSTETVEESYANVDKTIFKGKFLTGPKKGQIEHFIQEIDDVYSIGVKQVKAGHSILVYHEENNASHIEWVYGGHARFGYVIVLAAIFVALLLLLGGKQGFNTIVSMTFTCAAIFLVYIPSILTGKNIYAWSIMTCIFIIGMTLVIVNGISKKSVCAAAGCVGGVVVAGILAVTMDKLMLLSGMVNDESMYLRQIFGSGINLNALMFSAIIIGAVGAIMDVSISIASSLKEVVDNSRDISRKDLMKSGMTIGRDIMGTMSNTLVLAYIGGAVSTVILIMCYNNSFLEIFNKEMVVAEILQALCGSIGILLTIPFTAYLCSKLYVNKLSK